MSKFCENLTMKKIFHSSQFCILFFQDSYSALAVLQFIILQGKKDKNFVILLSLDIQVGYNSVYTDGLLMKCDTLGIKVHILKWIHFFLCSKNLKVRGVTAIPTLSHSTRASIKDLCQVLNCLQSPSIIWSRLLV